MAWFRIGGAGLPASLKNAMNRIFNKKFSTATDYAPETWPDTVNLMAMLGTETASGALVAFDNGADDVPIDEGVFNIDYTGDLITSMNIYRYSGNLLPPIGDTNFWESGKINPDTGELEDDVNYVRMKYFSPLTPSYMASHSSEWYLDQTKVRAKDFGISGPPKRFGWLAFYTKQKAFTSSVELSLNSYATIATLDNMLFFKISYYIGRVTVYDNPTISQWVYSSGSQDIGAVIDTYARSVVNVDWTSHGGIYGGYYNSKTGVLTSTKASDGTDLATPVEIQLDPVEIRTHKNFNAIYNDRGNSEITYRTQATITPVYPALMTKNITQNGSYDAEDDNAYGYDTVNVNVSPNVASKTVTENGTYNASSDSLDGYSSVTVQVSGGGLASVSPVLSNNAFATQSGVSGTDTERTVRTITMTEAGKLVFADGSYCTSNTGANDGYFDIRLNGTSVVKQYITTNTNTPISIPEIDVESGDAIDFVVGFDNQHSSCNFQLYTAITFVVGNIVFANNADDPFEIMSDYTRFNIQNLYSSYYLADGVIKKEIVFQMNTGSGYEGFCISLDGFNLTDGTQYTLSFVLDVPNTVSFSGSYAWGIKYSATRVPSSGSANTNTFNITPTVN